MNYATIKYCDIAREGVRTSLFVRAAAAIAPTVSTQWRGISTMVRPLPRKFAMKY